MRHPTLNYELTPMEEANVIARQKWGRAGFAVTERTGSHGNRTIICKVGTIGGDKLPNGTYPYGVGETWEAAFADADRRAAEDGEQPE